MIDLPAPIGPLARALGASLADLHANSRAWDAAADRLAADLRDYRTRLAATARANGGKL